MNETNEKKSNPTKQPKYKPNKKPLKKEDKINIAFFVVLIIALIVFTVILVLKSNEKTYIAEFGEDIISEVSLSDTNTVEITIDVKGILSSQIGTYEPIEDEIDNNYLITLNKDSNQITEAIEMVIENETLKLVYEDGSEILYKEK